MEIPNNPSEEEGSATNHVPHDEDNRDDGKDDVPVLEECADEEQQMITPAKQNETPEEEEQEHVDEEEQEHVDEEEQQEESTSTIANSPNGTLPIEEKLNTKDDESIEIINDATDTTSEKIISFSIDWSEAFKSPNVIGFSPSKIGSHHGLGLQLVVERSRNTVLFLGNISVFLSGVATIYEQLGIYLIKTSQTIRPQQLSSFKTPIDDDFQSLYESILHLSSGFRNSAICYRNTIISSLQKTLTDNGKVTGAFINQYREVKQASLEARKLALMNYSKCTNAVKAAEMEIQLWVSNMQQKKNDGIVSEESKEQGEIEISDTDFPWVKSLKLLGEKENKIESTLRLIQKLKVVQLCETRYVESVSKENELVKVVEEAEVLALGKTQQMERELLNSFVSVILGKVFPKDNNAEYVSVNPTGIRRNGDVDKPFTEGIEKKGKDLLANLFKQQSVPYEEGMGVMDAETLGLPESVGIKRDKVKSSFSTRGNRIKVTEIVIKLFEEIANVTFKSSSRMRSQIVNQRGRSSEDNSPAANLWRFSLNMLQDEAKLISESTFKISRLENWLINSRKNLANEIDMDDAAWKHVCDAARTETRFEARYKQTKQQRQRASSKELSKRGSGERQRASSKELFRRGSGDSSDDILQSQRKRNDSSGSIGTTTPNRVGRAFFKGGEAMKKLAEQSIVQIANIGVEADQKEANDQLALEEASATKNRAILAYTTYTTERIDKIESEDDAGWIEMKDTLGKLTESIRALYKVRCTVFEKRLSQELDSSFQSLVLNVEDWSKSVRGKILKSDQTSSSATGDIPGEYTLTTKVVKTDNIVQFLELKIGQSIIPKLKVSSESTNTRSEEEEIDNRETTVMTEPKPPNSSALNEEIPQKLLKKTIAPSTNSPNPSEDSGDESQSITTFTETNIVKEKEESPEIKAFVKQFWSKKPKDEKLPDIIEIYPCAYRPKEMVTFLTPYFPGRLYTTAEGIYFLGPEKNFTLPWEKISSIKKEIGFMGSNNENDLVITYRSKSTIVSFVICRLRSRDKTLIHLKNLKEESEKSKVSKTQNNNNSNNIVSNTKEVQLPPVPPDSLLKDMEIVVSKTIKNVSITSIFKNVWADLAGNKSFYGSWLDEEECFDTTMEDWKYEGELRNEWCNEKYTQERLVTFKFNRTTHLYIGPPVAFVKQRHFCRVEGDDRCIVAISAEFEGIPYADNFAVEMRWVATRKGTNNVHVQVGLFVVFKKNTMLKSQIKSGTIAETKNVHLRLFDAVKKACVSSEDVRLEKEDSKVEGDEDVDDDDDEDDDENEIIKTEENLLDKLQRNFAESTIASSIGAVAFLFAGRLLFRAIFGSGTLSDTQRLENRIEDLQSEVRALHVSIDLITGLLKEMRNERE